MVYSDLSILFVNFVLETIFFWMLPFVTLFFWCIFAFPYSNDDYRNRLNCR